MPKNKTNQNNGIATYKSRYESWKQSKKNFEKQQINLELQADSFCEDLRMFLKDEVE
jgi:hypothetical protein